MKILHIAPERGAAFVAARVVHKIAQNVSLSWAQTPAAALQWLQGNRDTAAVIVEVQAQSCAWFVEQLRGRGLTTPVVVVVGSARLEPALAALNSGADGYVVAGPSLEADLPRTGSGHQLRADAPADSRTAHRLGSVLPALLARETRICMALQQRLFELESALRKLTSGGRQRRSLSPTSSRAARGVHGEPGEGRPACDALAEPGAAMLDEARQARRDEPRGPASSPREESAPPLQVAAAEPPDTRAGRQRTRHRQRAASTWRRERAPGSARTPAHQEADSASSTGNLPPRPRIRGGLRHAAELTRAAARNCRPSTRARMRRSRARRRRAALRRQTAAAASA
jgi:CheY-like chemotaxis protein